MIWACNFELVTNRSNSRPLLDVIKACNDLCSSDVFDLQFSKLQKVLCCSAAYC